MQYESLKPLQEIAVEQYKEERLKKIYRRNAILLLVYLGLAGFSMVGIILSATQVRTLAICFFGVFYFLGLICVCYICIVTINRMKKKQISKVYKGEAVVYATKPMEFRYMDTEGVIKSIMAGDAAKDGAFDKDDMVKIIIENDTVAEVYIGV